MKTEKGVTLISVTIYVIVMLIVVSIITVLTVYFYRNVDVNSANEGIPTCHSEAGYFHFQ